MTTFPPMVEQLDHFLVSYKIVKLYLEQLFQWKGFIKVTFDGKWPEVNHNHKS